MRSTGFAWLCVCVVCLTVSRADAADIRTIAGNGRQTYSGDGGPAHEAGIGEPFGLTLGPDGALYVCSVKNHCIRRVDLRSGLIDTVAGTGQRGATSDGAPLAGTPLDGPRALDFDLRGQMFLALREGNAVFRVDLRGQKLMHLAGTGQKGFS